MISSAAAGSALLTLSALSVLSAPSVFAQENYASWTYSRSLVLNTKTSGANLANPVTQFPVLVRLTHANGGDVVYYSQGRGADLRFTKADGVTRLPHQIDSWDSAAHTATIWVLLDSVKPNDSLQSFKMFWNKTGVADSGNGGKVFDTANGYVDVWHLGNTNDVAARPNAIPGRFSATPVNFPGGYSRVAGAIGWADNLTGGGSSGATTYLAINEGASTPLYNFPAGNFTYSIWAKPTTLGRYARLISIVGDDAASGANRIFMAVADANGYVIGRLYADGASRAINSTTSATTGAWSHFAYTITRNGTSDVGTLYLNGVQIATATFTSPQQLADVERAWVRIGRDNINPSADSSLNAVVDEARISNVSRSADYLKLSYDIEKPGSAVVALGSTSPTPPAIPPASLFASASSSREKLGARPVSGGMAFRIPLALQGHAVRLTVTDLHGRLVGSRYFEAAITARGAEITWTGLHSRAAGVYVARLLATEETDPTEASAKSPDGYRTTFTLNP